MDSDGLLLHGPRQIYLDYPLVCAWWQADMYLLGRRALKRRYADLESQATTYEQVYDILRTRPQPEVEEVVRRIRAGENPGAIIRHVENGDLVFQLNVVPETRFRYEFPFRVALPPRLRTPQNPYFDSLIYEWEQESENDSEHHFQRPPRLLKDSSQSSQAIGVYLKPYHAAEIYDFLVDSAEPSKWTSVIKDNALLRNLLRAYFLHDYIWFTAFQKDYFLSDMIAGRRQFCSSLLVNAVLAIACHCDRSITDRVEFWNPHTLGYRFLNEARRLWEVEVASDKIRITTIQAAILLNYVYNMNSMVQLGWGYTIKAMELARKINLFKRPDNWETMDPRLRSGRDFTAWCLFEWQSHCTYFLFQPPLQDTPPEAPLPDTAHEPAWYGEVWLKYALEPSLYPYNFAQFFKAKSELRVILNDIGRICYGLTRLTPLYLPPLEKVAVLYERLKDWYGRLPESLLARKIVFSAQLKLHMHYHHAIITLLQPLLSAVATTVNDPHEEPVASANPLSISAILNSDSSDTTPSTPPTDSSENPSPDRPPPSLPPLQPTIAQARIHYETVLRLYYLRHGFEGFDPFLTSALLTNAFLTIEEIKACRESRPPPSHSSSRPSCPKGGEVDLDSLRSTLVLCAKGLYDQGKSFYLGQPLFKLVRDGMDEQEKELLRGFAVLQNEDAKDEEMRAGLTKELWQLAAVDTDQNIKQESSQEESSRSGSSTGEEEARGENYWKRMDRMLRKYGGLKVTDEEPGGEDDDGEILF
ncbi:hypothetical protein QBC38DRAFT_511316 [Podospora fimiseda]|uniref:Xylanolytic transcriptional activator regulatory domain-containing protein n=1 Tax=Podospora fimiseda TaxID=252190 RepID=A0AAN7BKM9_9PEZI|nr:hypothetical protein QBC38DRAFT_511316 [Podospora fimiseda]